MFNKKRTNEDFINQLKTVNPNYIPLEPYVNNTTHIKCLCKKHQLEFITIPKRILDGRLSCPKCDSERKRDNNIKSNNDFLLDLKEHEITDVVPLEEYKGNNVPILFKCSCGRDWVTTPARVLLGNHCKKCWYEKICGDGNYFYNPNLTDDERINTQYRFRNPDYKEFIAKCFERDKYTCRISDKISHGDIVVHHIQGYNWSLENRTNEYNGITLNCEIHKEFHKIYGKGNNTKEQFLEFITKLYTQDRISNKNLKSIINQINKIK